MLERCHSYYIMLRNNEFRRLSAFFILTLISFVIIMRIALVIVRVEGLSMLPTLAPGDRILALRCWLPIQFRRGQIVVVRPNQNSRIYPISSNLVLKRIVGMPRDRLFISDALSRGVVRINSAYSGKLNNGRVLQIPKGYYFVCGDNASYSADSRIWGSISSDNILAIAILKFPQKSQ